jgi:hypothetical protein
MYESQRFWEIPNITPDGLEWCTRIEFTAEELTMLESGIRARIKKLQSSWNNDARPTVSPDGIAYFNVYFKREAAFDSFKSTLSSSQSSKYKSNQFKSSLGAWCEYHGYTLNPIHLCTGTNAGEDRRILKNIDGKTTECFFVSTLGAQANIEDDLTPTADELSTLPF